MFISYSFYKRRVGSLHLHVCTCTPHLCNYVSQERLGRLGSNLVCGLGVINYVFYKSQWVGRICTCAPLFYISGTARRIELKFGGWLQLCFMQVFGWEHLHVRTCTPHLRISETDRPIVLKFEAWLDIQLLRGLQKPDVG